MGSLIKKSNFSKYSPITLTKIENPKYEDLLLFGNIVIISDADQSKLIHYMAIGNTIPSYAKRYFDKFTSDIPFALIRPYIENEKEDWCYTNAKYFKEDFPKSLYTNDKIVAVLKSNISLDDIKTPKKLWDIFRLYNISIVP